MGSKGARNHEQNKVPQSCVNLSLHLLRGHPWITLPSSESFSPNKDLMVQGDVLRCLLVPPGSLRAGRGPQDHRSMVPLTLNFLAERSLARCSNLLP